MLTGEIIDDSVKKFLDKRGSVAYLYNSTDGVDVEVFSYAALAEAHEKAGPDEREHVTTWIRKNLPCEYLDPLPGEYLSLNTAEDYERIKQLMTRRNEP
jgi:spore coat polysaccharide biosynthesis protein SpsF (cytidylyltransferase family)